jgi:hypothetical protein
VAINPEPKPKDALDLYSQLTDQHAIVAKRIREIVGRPHSRQESIKVIAAQLALMLKTLREMQTT